LKRPAAPSPDSTICGFEPISAGIASANGKIDPSGSDLLFD
jgi:hypothetical protein